MQGYLERIRGAELEVIKDLFEPDACVLEIGGGNGYQASVISSWGCKIVSLDLPRRTPHKPEYFQVQSYDGTKIPFPNKSFDIVFSSNVLEHIPATQLSVLFEEFHRVMKNDGKLIHLLPSTSWRVWTILFYYPYLIKKMMARLLTPRKAESNQSGEKSKSANLSYLARHIWFVAPHGAYPNALSELYFYSRVRWMKLFESKRFRVQDILTNKLFYTGYQLMPGASLRLRRVLSYLLRPSCYVYLLTTR